MKLRATGRLTALLVGLVVLVGCMVVEDSPAPGCVRRIGLGGMGGCFGKTAIINLAVEPEIDCLSIEANNCNGGVLDVDNRCSDPLVLGGVTVQPSDRAALDVVETDGGYSLVDVASNFSDYVPAEDRQITLSGTLGDRLITVSFTKTRQLCD